ncbi:radical SAM protein, partial [Bacteroidales bacterium OttesenSCG-928-C19]|nr:radical SAM protein [Bacteroidales bacterium OttesenSCG-928-C19]
ANVSVLTNGTLLTESDLSVFKELGVNKVQIPILSANPAIHDELTQVQGSWKKAVSNAEKIIKTNSEKFNAVLVLTKQNILNIEETLSFYESLGVKTALVNRFNIGGLGRKHRDELELSHSELKKVFEQINNFGKARSIRFFSGVCTPMCILNPADYPYIGFSFCNKDVSSRPITINTKGDVRFCNHSPNVLGNIFEKPLKDILYSETYNSYFNTTPEYCASCSLLSLCQGGCRAASEQLYNTFSKADPVVDIK